MAIETKNGKLEKQKSSEAVFFNTEGLSERLLNNLTGYFNNKLDNTNDGIHSNNMHRIIFYRTIENTLFALFLYELESESFLVNEGYFHGEVEKLIHNYKHFLFEKEGDQVFQVYLDNDMFDVKFRLKAFAGKHYIFGAIALDAGIIDDIFNDTEKLLYRFYFQNNDFLKEVCYYDSMPEINANIAKIKDESVLKHESMHLILIEIEPLKKYIKVAGDYLVNEIIRSVKTEINAMLGGQGICHILNSRQYLIVAHGIDEDFIKEHFGHAHFRIKNLLLVYQMKYYELADLSEECNIAIAWSHLLI